MAAGRISVVALVVSSVLLGQSALAVAEERDAAAPSGKPAMMMTLGGNLADLFTSLSVISSGAGSEANPILGQNPARVVAIKSLLIVPQILAERHLASHGHPKVAFWLGMTLGGLGTAMAIHNMQIARGGR